MQKIKKLAIVTTHPIQYYAPIFQLLHQHKKLEIKIFYTWGEAGLNPNDPGFGRNISWDIPVLEGYNFQFEKNTAKNPGSHRFWGIKNHSLTKNIKAWKADALLVFGWAYQSHLQTLIHFKNKIPVFFRGDSTLLDKKNSAKNSIKTFSLRLIYTRVDHAFYVGINNKAYFKYFGLQEKQLSFVPHAVDNERFAEDKFTEASALRKQLGIGLEEILILFAGKLELKKNPDLLLQAFETCNQPNTHLLFVGSGPLEEELKTKKLLQKTASRIHFLNFQNQLRMPVIYQACDLFCLPSSGPGETWGLAVNEAMACSKAILVSDKVGCAIDLVAEGKNGAVFQAGNVDDLAKKLHQMCQQKIILKEYGAVSAQIIKNWNFKVAVEAMQNKILEYV
jgi:glycosyltransferase involved in cell wall biosynthesis